jgi:phosphate-selective porin O/P
MQRRTRGGMGNALFLFLSLFLARTEPAPAQVIVKVNDQIHFRFGAQLQTWAEWIQDPNSGGYSANFYIRRIRAMILATLSPSLSIFYLTDNPSVGNSGTIGNKNVSTGFQTQDAFLEWKLLGDQIKFNAGLYYIPQSRNVLSSTNSTLALAGANFVQLQNTFTQSTNGRDYGFGLTGYLADDHLEYRAGVFDGQRQGATPQPAPLGPAAGSRNSYLFGARLQYDVFDTEKGYTYVGTNRGARKILAIGAWGNFQGDYKAYGGDVMADFPTGKHGAITWEGDYLWYDGGTQFQQIVNGQPTPLLPKENTLYTHLGYLFTDIQLQPFFRYEFLDFSASTFQSRQFRRYGGGLNWYIYGQNLKITAFYERVVPETQPGTALQKSFDHFVVQLQAFYF